MITKQILRCTHCNGEAREYFGLEGGTYIGKTPFECPKSPDKEHDFQPSKEAIPENERPEVGTMINFFGGIGAHVDVTRKPDDLFQHDFMGTVKGAHGNFITVEDQEGKAWDCEIYQLTYSNE